MFIKEKPISFGYKIWCLCGSDSYPCHMQIYQGKQSNANDQPLGTRVINNMVSIISSNSNVLYHQLYFDNFFSSYHLINELTEKSMRATGNTQKNRTEGANKQLIQIKELQKQEKGIYDYCSDGKVYIAKWHDNSVVNIASNWETHDPVRKLKRRIKRGAKEVAQPHLIGSYDKGMGDIDLIELPQDVRFDKINHFQGPTSQRCCKMCKNNTKTICKKMQCTLACRTWQALF